MSKGRLVFVSKHIAVLDIGTTGVRILAGKVNDRGLPQIIAKVDVSCKGLKKCSIEDESAIVDAVKAALRRIKDQTGLIIRSVYTSIQGANLSFMRNTDSISLPTEEPEITYQQLGKLLDKAASIETYEDEKLIDIIPVKYFINDETQVNDPLGLSAETLRVEANVVLGKYEYIKQITACINAAGLTVDGFIPSSVAMTWALPSEEETAKSVLLLDVGGSASDYTLYYKGRPYAIGSVPMGGQHITNDLSLVLHISPTEAETVKRDYPLASAELVSNNVDVAVFSLEKGAQDVLKVSDIVDVMQARIENLFEVVAEKLEEEEIQISRIDYIMVIGDGLSKFKGLDLVCEKLFHVPYYDVDLSRSTGMKSAYSYASGMLMYMASQLPLGRKPSKLEREYQQNDGGESEKPKESGISNFWNKVKSMLVSFRE